MVLPHPFYTVAFGTLSQLQEVMKDGVCSHKVNFMVLPHPFYTVAFGTVSQLEDVMKDGVCEDALSIAVEYDRLDHVRFLVEHGANIHYSNDVALRVCTTTPIMELRHFSHVHTYFDWVKWPAPPPPSARISRYLYRRACDYYMTRLFGRNTQTVLQEMYEHHNTLTNVLHIVMGRAVALDVQHIVVEMLVGTSVMRYFRKDRRQ